MNNETVSLEVAIEVVLRNGPTFETIAGLCKMAVNAQRNEFNPDWDVMAVMVEEQQRMASEIERLKDALNKSELRLHEVAVHCEQVERNRDAALLALRQAEQAQPFGYFRYDLRLDAWVQNRAGITGTPFYTAPPQRKPWVGLTGDEVNEFAAGCHLGNSVQGAIRKAEAKLKEKNT